MTEQSNNPRKWPVPIETLMEWIPARLRRGTAVVPVVRLSGLIGAVTPLRPGMSLAGVARTLERAFAVKNAKAGQVQFRVDKAGIIHATIGRASFEPTALRTNLAALVEALQKAKPATSKGVYLRKIALSSTMGVGVRVDQATLAAQ